MGLNEGYRYEERIEPRDAGSSLLDYLCRCHRHSDRDQWRERIRDGAVTLDRRSAATGERLQSGQLLSWQRPPWQEPEAPTGFTVIFEDEQLLAVDKPAGLPSLPGGGFFEHTLLRQVRRRYAAAAPLHRLGRHTSGLVLFARTARARARLAEQFRCRRVVKQYLALASGSPTRERFEIDATIGAVPHARLGSVHAATADGKEALTRVHVVERREERFVARVSIVTGRPHQIRIHLATAGHPLIGDPLYAAGGVPLGDALPGDGGYHLHATNLELDHPLTCQRIVLACAPPGDSPLNPRQGPGG